MLGCALEVVGWVKRTGALPHLRKGSQAGQAEPDELSLGLFGKGLKKKSESTDPVTLIRIGHQLEAGVNIKSGLLIEGQIVCIVVLDLFSVESAF